MRTTRRGLRGHAVRRGRPADGARARGCRRGRRGGREGALGELERGSPSAAQASCSTARARAGPACGSRPAGRGREPSAGARSERGLSPAALEALAVVAYLQPIGRPEIARIRGVSSDAVVDRPAGARVDRGGGPRRRAWRARPVPHDDRLRAHLRARGGTRGPSGTRDRGSARRRRVAPAPARGRLRARLETPPMSAEAQRLNRYLAACGLGSRRGVEAFVTDGRVTIDGVVATSPGQRVPRGGARRARRPAGRPR